MKRLDTKLIKFGWGSRGDRVGISCVCDQNQQGLHYDGLACVLHVCLSVCSYVCTYVCVSRSFPISADAIHNSIQKCDDIFTHSYVRTLQICIRLTNTTTHSFRVCTSHTTQCRHYANLRHKSTCYRHIQQDHPPSTTQYTIYYARSERLFVREKYLSGLPRPASSTVVVSGDEISTNFLY